MERLFPEIKKHEEPMAFALSGDGFGTKHIISVLIRPSSDGVECFRNSSGHYKMMITCCLINENDGKKLGFRLEFPCEDRIVGFDGKINPGDPTQKEIINILRINKEIFIWVVDQKGCVVKVISMDWDYDAHKEVLDMLLDN